MAYYFSLYEVLKVHPASSFLRKVDAVKSQLLRFYFLSSMRFQCSASDESTSSAVLIFEILLPLIFEILIVIKQSYHARISSYILSLFNFF